MRRYGWVLGVLALLAGCTGGARVIRADTDETPRLFVPAHRGTRPLELEGVGFDEALATLARGARPSGLAQQAAWRLLEVSPRSGAYVYDARANRLTPLESGGRGEVADPREVELTRLYRRWCENTGRAGDCLGLLTEGPTLHGDGRYALAMTLAQGVVWEEMKEAFKGMAHPQALMSAVLWTWTTYMILLTVPEPVTKGIAAVMTAVLIVYVGVDTFWELIVGFKQLVEEADGATTFGGLKAAGERYGKVMGRNAARAFVMLATAAVGQTTASLAAKVPTLPVAMQAAERAESQMGLRLAAVGQVETVAVSAEGVTLALAPGAVAMSTTGGPSGGGVRAWGSFSGFKRAMGPAGPGQEWHHLVEQTPGNVNRFGPEALHSTNNVIALRKALHGRISAFYSSIQWDLTGSFSMTVRQWLSTQPYAAQREFGLLAIKKVADGSWR